MATKKKGLLAAAGNAAASGGGGGGYITNRDVNTTAYTKIYFHSQDDHRAVKTTLYDNGYIFGVEPAGDSSTMFSAGAMEIDNEDEYLWIGSYGKVASIDISGTFNSSAVSTAYNNSTYANLMLDMAIHKSASTLYGTAYSSNYVLSFDISNPTSLTLQDSYSFANAKALYLDDTNEVLYVTDASSNLKIFDVSDPSNITQTASYSNATYISNPADIALDETTGILYIANGGIAKFTAIDVSNTSNILPVGSFTTPYGCLSVCLSVQDEIAYLSHASALVAVDISTPSSMSSLGTLNGATFYEMQLDHVQEFAIGVMGGNNSVKSVDISNPSSMSQLSNYTNTSYIDDPRILRLGY